MMRPIYILCTAMVMLLLPCATYADDYQDCKSSCGGRGKLVLEVKTMPTISGRALSIFKDACGVHEFSTEERARIDALAEQVNQVLQTSKDRLAGKEWQDTLRGKEQGGDIPRNPVAPSVLSGRTEPL